MTTVGDKRVNDWNRLARGMPSVALVKDPETRRALEALYQDRKYVNIKIRDIHKPGPEDKLTDVTKNTAGKNKDPRWPEAVMISATWDEATSATIVGKVNPKGSSTDYYFQYMHVAYDIATDTYPDPDFSSPEVTTTKSAGDGSIAVSKSELLSDVVLVSRYYVQLVATNANGTAYSNIISFDTCNVPDFTLDEASLVTQSTATLNGTVNPNGIATTYHFAYGTTPDCTSSTTDVDAGSGTTAVTATAALTGLMYNTKYYFKIVAVNACGINDDCAFGQSETKRFTTLDTNVPRVTNNGASHVSDVSAHISGTIMDRNAKIASWNFPVGQNHGLVTYGKNIAVDTMVAPFVTNPSGQTDGLGTIIPISFDIGDLMPDTQYWCQLIGTIDPGGTPNPKTTAFSDIWGFTTVIAELTLTGSLGYSGFVTGDTRTEVKIATVENSGTAASTLNWTATLTLDAGISGKIVADVASGALHGGESTPVSLTLTQSGVAAGTYTGTLSVSGLYVETKTLPITLTVYPVYTGQVYFVQVLKWDGVTQSNNVWALNYYATGAGYIPQWPQGNFFRVGKSTLPESDDQPALGTWGGRYGDTAGWQVYGDTDIARFATGFDEFGCPTGSKIYHLLGHPNKITYEISWYKEP